MTDTDANTHIHTETSGTSVILFDTPLIGIHCTTAWSVADSDKDDDWLCVRFPDICQGGAGPVWSPWADPNRAERMLVQEPDANLDPPNACQDGRGWS